MLKDNSDDESSSKRIFGDFQKNLANGCFMNSLVIKLISFITAQCFFCSTLLALPTEIPRLPDVSRQPTATEYYMSHLPGEIITTVNVIGSVNKPGLYYTPKNTDLFRLIAAAGGLRDNAEASEITIKRRLEKQATIIKVDFTENMSNAQSISALLEAEDVVNIPFQEPLVSQNSLTLLGLISSILSIIISAIIVQKTFE